MNKPLLLVLMGVLLSIWSGCVGVRELRVQRPGEKTEDGKALSGTSSLFPIRVAVEKDLHSFTISARDARISSGGRTLSLSGEERLEVQAGSARIGRAILTLPLTIRSDYPVVVNGLPYTGEIAVYRDLVLNVLPLETYLRGVLVSEIPDSWPAEALKAQAVVSRTFALRRILDRKQEPFDVDDTEMDQKYTYAERNARIDSAIRGTERLILSYNHEPIEAFFHANSGGVTENCSDVFQKDLPYLRSVEDPYTTRAGNAPWTYAVGAGELSMKIALLADLKVRSSSLKDVRVRAKTESGRAREFVLLFGRGGEVILRGNDLRLALDPKSFRSLLVERIDRMLVNGEYLFTFYGRGYGHGVGMSQVGAKAMAEMGFGYREILSFYYRGARVERWDER